MLTGRRRPKSRRRRTAKAHPGFRDAVRRFDEIIPGERRDDAEIRRVLVAIDNRLGERGPLYLNLLVDMLRALLVRREAVEAGEAFGARTKARRDEARVIRKNLGKWLRRALAFYREHFPSESADRPRLAQRHPALLLADLYAWALLDVERGGLAWAAGVEPHRSRGRGRPADKRAHAIGEAVRRVPGLRKHEADVLARAILPAIPTEN